jgi:hypothetical protein
MVPAHGCGPRIYLHYDIGGYITSLQLIGIQSSNSLLRVYRQLEARPGTSSTAASTAGSVPRPPPPRPVSTSVLPEAPKSSLHRPSFSPHGPPSHALPIQPCQRRVRHLASSRGAQAAGRTSIAFPAPFAGYVHITLARHTLVRDSDIPLRHKVLRHVAVPLGQPRRRTMHDRLQLCKHVGIRFRRIGVAAHCEFNDTQPDGPYVGRDGVCAEVVLGLALDPFGLRGFFSSRCTAGALPRLTAI